MQLQQHLLSSSFSLFFSFVDRTHTIFQFASLPLQIVHHRHHREIEKSAERINFLLSCAIAQCSSIHLGSRFPSTLTCVSISHPPSASSSLVMIFDRRKICCCWNYGANREGMYMCVCAGHQTRSRSRESCRSQLQSFGGMILLD